ncbi:hypothetical protein [Donghicola sp.]|jgi:hypothetical protein|uniref:hypothetical protein n=1 Tax=Donghicola sp. TaxID=1929294 RepID=UPI0025F4B946|nr:hypothetical protein [Donghicola sp.]MCT4576883.1 hypothetical protein [Donghicola sp.]
MSDKSEDRLALEARADALGVSYQWNTGDELLLSRITEAEEAAAAAPQAEAQEEGTATAAPEPEASAAVPQGDENDVAPWGLTDDDVLIVTGPRKGRWRAGLKFGPEPVRIPVSELTDEEVEAISGDPKLTVEVEDGSDD